MHVVDLRKLYVKNIPKELDVIGQQDLQKQKPMSREGKR